MTLISSWTNHALAGYLLLLTVATSMRDGTDSPLPQAHAHNDYLHARPLLDALDQGFCSVEADIFLGKNGQLLVGHTTLDLQAERTLERLYLAPLRERVRQFQGRVYPNGPTLQLLIDVKTAGPQTYAVLHPLLASYADILTEVRKGQVIERAVTVVISGNCPREEIAKQALRYAAIDGRLDDLTSSLPKHLVPLVSLPWKTHFTGKGDAPLTGPEMARLREMTALAHKHGRRLRFWGSPDTPECWRVQREAGVDWLNTDRLREMRAFLLNR